MRTGAIDPTKTRYKRTARKTGPFLVKTEDYLLSASCLASLRICGIIASTMQMIASGMR